MKAVAYEHGDFTHLAEKYANFRPDYAPSVLHAILGMVNKPNAAIDAVDVGAGTGIWTRMLASAGLKSVTAVEPCDEMRKMGEIHPMNGAIRWVKGSGESTNLADQSADILSMASSFHWVNFDVGTKEFCRVLKENGHFVALWNPRHIQDNQTLVDIEKKIYDLSPNVTRVSSGKSNFVDELSNKLNQSPLFSDVTYLEGKHSIAMTPEQYIGAWESVNDIRVQMGEEKFAQFMQYVKLKVTSLEVIQCTYLTRAWVAKKR